MPTLCNLCNRKNLQHMNVIKCYHCKSVYHISCISCKNSDLYTDQWFCVICIGNIFPFSEVDDSEFIHIAKDIYNVNAIPISELNDKIFNPFEYNDTFIDRPLVDVDPDINYFNNVAAVSNVTSCNYYTEDMFNQKCQGLSKITKCFSLIHLNIRSAVKNLDSFDNYLNNINHSFSFIGLTETWFTVDSAPTYNLDNYNIENLYRYHSKGGGVSILVRNEIQYKVRTDLNVNDFNFQLLFIEVSKDVFPSESDIIIGVLYRPPNTSVDIFNEKLNAILSKIHTEKAVIYLMGDFNINLINESNHLQTSEFIEMMYSYSLFPLITKPTRMNSTNATLIDNIFCNDIEFQKFINGIFFTDISDHFPVFTIKLSLIIDHTIPFIKTRDLSFQNINKFKEKLNCKNWSTVYNCNNADQAFTQFYKIFCETYYQCFPIKIIKSKYKSRKIWLSNGLKVSIKHKNKLYVLAKRSPTPENIKNYKMYKINLSRLIRTAERQHFDKIFKENKQNLRNTWKIIKDVIKQTNNNKITNKFHINNNVTSEPNIIANSFNNFFTNVGKNLAGKIPLSKINPLHYMKNTNLRSFALNHVNTDEIKNIIKMLKKSTIGPDGINSNILKVSYESLLNPLVYSVNLSFNQGIFPDELKLAHITPVYKTGDNSLINNYRPISILSVFSKIYERLMYNRLFNFIKSCNIHTI